MKNKVLVNFQTKTAKADVLTKNESSFTSGKLASLAGLGFPITKV